MLRNFFIITCRNLLRHKIFSLINLFGLAIGMAACLLIVMFIVDEVSFDGHHAYKHRIYRVEGQSLRGGQQMEPFARTNFGLAPLLKTAFPAIERYVRMDIGPQRVSFQQQQYLEERVAFADSTFFEVFSFPFLQGNAQRALDEPNSVVITDQIARKYFGQSNPMNQRLTIDGDVVKVTGVIKEAPRSAHFGVDLVVSVQTVSGRYQDWMRQPWSGGASHYTYLLLPEHYDPGTIQAGLGDFVTRYIGKDAFEQMQFWLQPLTSIHLHSQSNDQIQANGSITYVYIFAAVALLILLIAGINFTNLSTARSLERAKEVGLRKVVGAQPWQLIGQFLAESVLLSVLAMVVAYLLAFLAMPWFNALSGKALSLPPLRNGWIAAGLLGSSLLVGLLAGSYPAFRLSAFQPTRVLKGQVSPSGRSGRLRKGLVVLQFSISIGLMAATWLIFRQLQFIQQKDLGIRTDQVLTIPLTAKLSQQFEAFKTELLRSGQVLGVTGASNGLTTGGTNWRQYLLENSTIEAYSIATMEVEPDFFSTLQAQILAGRGFSKDFPSDVTEAYVVNETAVKFLHLAHPVNEPLLGTLFNGTKWSSKQGRIVGVVKDFHFSSLREPIKPVVFNLSSAQTDPLQSMWVRLLGNQLPASIQLVEQAWKQFEPEFPFRYTFLEEDIAQLYRAEERFLRVLLTFAALAILLACLGIFGLASYTAQQRTKEIGIRKVLGASVTSMVLLLTQEFTQLVLLSLGLAIPLAWYMMGKWLQQFAYRIAIDASVFLWSGLAALVIAWLTVSYQSIRAARMNPVNSLRNE